MSGNLSETEVKMLLNFTLTSTNNFNSSVAIINNLLESEKNHKAVIAHINQLLKSQYKEQAYVYLNHIVSSISKDDISENIVFWIKSVVEHSTLNKESSLWYIAISNLIQASKTNQDFNKLMVSSLLSKIIDECLSVKLETFLAQNALLCLSICLEEYSQSCLPFKNKIELHILECLSLKTGNVKVIKNAALCFLKLQKIGNPGPEHKNHKNNWRNTFQKLCFTMDTLYDSFFEDIEEFNSYEKPIMEPYILADIPKIISSNETLNIIENRLENICLFLRGMLENEFNSSKCIYPQYTLDIITRSLSLHICGNKSDNSLLQFSVLLIKHQTTILYVLRSVIAALELSLLPFSGAITKLLIDCLTRTNRCNCFSHTSKYKEAVYKVLEYWIETLKNCINGNAHNKILNLIIADISPITTDISLSISNLTSVSKKKEKKLMQEKIIAGTSKLANIKEYSKNHLNTKEEVCYQALSCLLSLLQLVYLSVEETTIKKLYLTLTQAILSIHYGKATTPYKNEKVQVKLFETLVATLECAKPPSIGLIVNILKEGEKNSNAAISLTCCVGLNLIEKVCQPTTCPWSFVKLSESAQIGDNNSEVDFTETTPTLKQLVKPCFDQKTFQERNDEDRELGIQTIASIKSSDSYITKEKLVEQEEIPMDTLNKLNPYTEEENVLEKNMIIEMETNSNYTKIKSDEVTEEMQNEECPMQPCEKEITEKDLPTKLIESASYQLSKNIDEKVIQNNTEEMQNGLCPIQPCEKENILRNALPTEQVEDLLHELNENIDAKVIHSCSEKHSVDDDSQESVKKKLKVTNSSSPDIDEMLKSFVDKTAES